ncbi:MAG: xanthine dehydrogenase family protein molybdopterin-binding subunit [Calditrichae bacterium]|nr:xanthine dehydrogenase family protein molybdopterin-binding subunit [Calditrichia bacterium]
MSDKKITKSRFWFEEHEVETISEVPNKKIKPWASDAKLDVVGKPISRIDGPDKVSGRAKYTFDRLLPDTAIAKTLRCPFPHARIKKIDFSKALKLPGVLAVITNEDAPSIPWFHESTLFDSHARYQGDEIACVAAENEAIAEAALKLIDVEYEKLAFVSSAAQGMKNNTPKLYDSGNIHHGKPTIYQRGDAVSGFKEADVIVEDTFTTQCAVHNPLEPHGSLVKWDSDHLTVWDSTQSVFGVRGKVAESLGIPENNVRIIKQYMGGGFGSKLEAGKYTVMAALLAKKLKRPVKIVMDRQEMNLAMGNRPDSTQTIKAGVKKDGTISALSQKSFGAAGAYPSGTGTSWPLRSMYQCPNIYTEEYTVFINAGPGRPFRAPGHVQGTFAFESLLEQAAAKIKMDPLEFRIKNYAEIDQVGNVPYTSKRLRECYELGAKAIGWNKRNKIAGSGKGSIRHGIGMASQIWWGGGGPPAKATMKLTADGQLQVFSGTQDLGTGSYTFIAMVAAEVLEIPMDKIKVVLGDTEICPYAPGSGGSVTAPSVSPAIRDAAEQMKYKLLSFAAVLSHEPIENMRYKNGVITSVNMSSTKYKIEDLVGKLSEKEIVTHGDREANPEGMAIQTFGAQFADVDVDMDTGKIKVNRMVAAHDIGRMLNRKLLENQFHGGIIQGMSFALLEERVIDNNTGKVLSTNLHDYKIPTIADIPEIEVIIASDSDPKISNTGVKGIGEPAIIPTAGAIANAVYNAIGVQVKDLPMTPDKVLKALGNA